MNTELMEALTILEKEKNISKDVMMDAIENSLISACKNHFGTAENIKVIMDRETCDYAVYAEKKVVEESDKSGAGDQPGRSGEARFCPSGRRCGTDSGTVKRIRPYRNAEREEPHPSENQGRGEKVVL